LVNQLGHQRQRRRRQVQLKSPDVFTAAMSPQETVFSSVNEGFDPENSDFFVETHLPTGFHRHSPRKWIGFVIGKSDKINLQKASARILMGMGQNLAYPLVN
jgi:hypothetical protein